MFKKIRKEIRKMREEYNTPEMQERIQKALCDAYSFQYLHPAYLRH